MISAAALAPPKRRRLAAGLAGKLLLHDVVELGERARLHAVERCDTRHDIRRARFAGSCASTSAA